MKRRHSKGTRTGEYRSPLEKQVVETIPEGIEVTYEPHKLQYSIDYEYTPDFFIGVPGSHSFYVEVKGWFKYEDKRKMLAVKQQNPGVDIRMVFRDNNKKDVRWCE